MARFIGCCVGLTDYETSFFAMAIWGDDPLTEEVDGVPNGSENVICSSHS